MGVPKAALVVHGEQLAVRTAGLLTDVADPVIEVGPGYTPLVRVQEPSPGDGPLAAIAAGWAFLDSRDEAAPSQVIVVATDLPRLTVGLLRLLASSKAAGCVIPVDSAGRLQLLCARYPAGTLAKAAGLLALGRRAVLALLDGQEVSRLAPAVWQVAAGRADALADVDTPADLAGLGGPARR
jgi:molybdopterin-guanine dinucleotide biosynthesis protein A